MKIKEVGVWANDALSQGVNNFAQLKDVVPTLVEAQAQVASLNKALRVINKTLRALSDECAEYAKDHPSLLDGCMTSANGVESVDLTINGNVYHCSFGYDGYKRDDGCDMDQEFLATLPVEWLKTKTELSKSAVNASHPTLETLEEHGLMQVPKNIWSLCDQGSVFE